jgi:putative Mg2+ transporter-C (MgtC) family protein
LADLAVLAVVPRGLARRALVRDAGLLRVAMFAPPVTPSTGVHQTPIDALRQAAACSACYHFRDVRNEQCEARRAMPAPRAAAQRAMITHTDVLLRLVIAAALGSVIGIERERLAWVAGLRTHMLVCVGSALMMIVSAFGFGDVLGRDHVVLDPSRIAAQVVSGIGFLGAGTILLRQDTIRGLTTAASLWTVAGIGLAVGGGMYVAAFGATVLIFLILAGIKPLERRFWSGSRQAHVVTVLLDPATASIEAIEAALREMPLTVQTLALLPGQRDDEQEMQVLVTRIPQSELVTLTKRIAGFPGVRRVTLGER